MIRSLLAIAIVPLLALCPQAHAGDKVAEDPAATRLLKNARQARAGWKKFPGFTAKLSVNHNGQVMRGSLKIDATGKVELDGFQAGSLKSRVRRQLASLVMHRISNAAVRETPCAFADKNAYHPLGRKILVLNDELHSSYRIRDRQIIEVNRRMKKTRFTITVLKNYETPEKTFLPAAYVVNVWNPQTGQLVSSTAHYNNWKRVGKYDLPTMVMLVTANGTATAKVNTTNATGDAAQTQPLEALTLTFSNHKLNR